MAKLSKNKEFNKMMLSQIISSGILALVGLFMFIKADLSIRLLGIMLGICMVFIGLVFIREYLKRDGAKLYNFSLFFGLILIIMGALAILMPAKVSSFLTVCLAIYLIVIGVNRITYGYWLKVGGDSSSLITIVIGIFLVVLGLLMFVNPFANLTITKLIGIFLILSSALEIIDTVLLKKRSEEIVKIFW